MKIKCFFVILIITAFLGLLISSAGAASPVDVYVFYGEGCPHCAKEMSYLKNYNQQHDARIATRTYEVWSNRDNAKLYDQVIDYYDIQTGGVPLTVIGNETLVGYSNDQTSGAVLNQYIEQCYATDCESDVEQIIKDEQPLPPVSQDGEKNQSQINLPFIGNVNTASFSLPVLTILIAAVDGFNPCAMWVLMFLISLLLGMKNRRRMWIIGSTFIVASALVYFLFLTAWLNLFIFLGFINWIRAIIGLIAIGAGLYYLKEYWQNKKAECKVEAGGFKQKIKESLEDIARSPHFVLALLGIIIIAFAVNLVELVCSIGLPAIYTQVLSLSDIPAWQYYLFLLLYVFIFMLDDLVVFVIAMIALKSVAFTGKYSRFANLVGGIIILILGILLIFRPEWLMFG